jgi:hypothetical protein
MHTFLLLLILIALLGGGPLLMRYGRYLAFVIGVIAAWVIPFGALAAGLFYLNPKVDFGHIALRSGVYLTMVIALHMLVYSGQRIVLWLDHLVERTAHLKSNKLSVCLTWYLYDSLRRRFQSR